MLKEYSDIEVFDLHFYLNLISHFFLCSRKTPKYSQSILTLRSMTLLVNINYLNLFFFIVHKVQHFNNVKSFYYLVN